MFWNKKSKKTSTDWRDLTLRTGIFSTLVSLVLAISTLWLASEMYDGPRFFQLQQHIFMGAVTFFLIALACFFILALLFISKKIK